MELRKLKATMGLSMGKRSWEGVQGLEETPEQRSWGKLRGYLRQFVPEMYHWQGLFAAP